MATDPSQEMTQLAKSILADLQQPISTTFYQWCCSRFRVSNTITRDLGSGISPQRGAFIFDEEGDCFARSGRYWSNHCIRSNPSRLADFQHMRETIFTNRAPNASPLVLRLHPYENYLTVADRNGNLHFYDLSDAPTLTSTLQVSKNDVPSPRVSSINASSSPRWAPMDRPSIHSTTSMLMIEH